MTRIGVDWGSSSFRAYLYDDQFKPLDTISHDTGIKNVADHGSGESKGGSREFESVLFDHVGPWLAPSDTQNDIVLSGMITSRNGWIETPYLECPADPIHTLDTATRIKLQHRGKLVNLFFLPGLCQRQPLADVMRGEELQLVGAASGSGDTEFSTKHVDGQWMVLPGTHSKWAQVTNKSVQRFHTIITGELFDVLLNHTLVGQLAEGSANRSDLTVGDERFLEAVATGFSDSTTISQLFTCRSAVLLDELNAIDVRNHLSGLLIGAELREGTQMMERYDREHNTQSRLAPISLIGSPSLCVLYAKACDSLGLAYIEDKSAHQTGKKMLNENPDDASKGFEVFFKAMQQNHLKS